VTGGSALDFTGVSFGITPADLISSAANFISAFGPWLLLGLVVVFAPYMVSFIKSLIKKNGRRAS
jgi:hypothetical protein